VTHLVIWWCLVQTECRVCNKRTWSGCGGHIDSALRGVPESNICKCDNKQVKRDCPGCSKPFQHHTPGGLNAVYQVHFKDSPDCREPYEKAIAEEGNGCIIM